MTPSGTKEPDQTPKRQKQEHQPGKEKAMDPQPLVIRQDYRGSGRLQGRVALITGGDSGIGRSVAVHFAREGADVAISYLDEEEDARDTQRMVEQESRNCLLFRGDIGQPAFCKGLVEQVRKHYGKLDILVNNAAEQHTQQKLTDITDEQLHRTFQTNLFAQFYLDRAAIPLLPRGGSIINTTSVVAYRGKPDLIDYAATKGAIVALTRSLALSLIGDGIRVNAVAPGPIWTPLIPASFEAEQVETFGTGKPMGRPGQPAEVAPSYVFLASEDASFMTGQVLHVNGGDFIST